MTKPSPSSCGPVLEVRRGHRLAIIEAETQRAASEVASPSFTQIEWTAHREKVTLTTAEAARLEKAVDEPAAPHETLKQAFSRRAKAKQVGMDAFMNELIAETTSSAGFEPGVSALDVFDANDVGHGLVQLTGDECPADATLGDDR